MLLTESSLEDAAVVGKAADWPLEVDVEGLLFQGHGRSPIQSIFDRTQSINPVKWLLAMPLFQHWAPTASNNRDKSGRMAAQVAVQTI